MTAKDRGRILLVLFTAGLICLGIIVAAAYGAAINYTNNQLRADNVALESEVDTLEIQIQSANNVAKIQNAAQEELGMDYPSGSQLVLLSDLQEQTRFGSVLRTTGSR